MAIEIKYSQSYLWLNSWILANIIQLSTQNFCDRFVDYKSDPCRRLYDQMVMAARSGVANIAEGTSRGSTSTETKMRLLDVARASIDELQGDYFNYLLRHGAEIWAIGNIDRENIWKTNLDTPTYGQSFLHDAGIHILKQKAKFDLWINNSSSFIAANAILILCLKLNKMLQSQMADSLDSFRENGGFSENMTQERIEAKRKQAIEAKVPKCPQCGMPMWKKMQKRGVNQGREFWGCSGFPNCRCILPIE